MRVTLVAALVASLLVPLVAFAQSAAPGSTDLQIELKRKRAIVRPRPDWGAAAEDARNATEVIDARRRQDQTVSDALTPPSRRRPDLGYDVQSGIQARNIRDALRSIRR